MVALFPAQAIFGKPKIKIEMGETGVIGDDIFFQYNVRNMPITNRLLRLLGVRRLTAEGATSFCQVTNTNTKKNYRMIPKIYDYAGQLEQRVNIIAGELPFTVSFLVVEKNGTVSLMDKKLSKLKEGLYLLQAAVYFEGKRCYKSQLFMVIEGSPYCRWVNMEKKQKPKSRLGVSRKQFHSLIKKASQPIKKSEKEKS